MKFSEHLSSHLTPEWRKQYIQYDILKDLLYKIKEKLPTDPEFFHRALKQEEEGFFKRCTEELERVNLFFAQKIAEAQSRFRDLQHELDELKSHLSKVKEESFMGKLRTRLKGDTDEATHKGTTMRSMKLAFSEFYLSLILLQNYQQLNATGFKKILKKHDKVLETSSGLEWRTNNVEIAPFYLNKEIDNLISETEQLVTQDLEDGNRTTAMKRLRVPPLSEKQAALTTFKLGLFIGGFSILLLLIVFTITMRPLVDEPKWIAVRLFRGFAILFTNVFLVGINMYGWQSAGVNHVLIFEIDPRNHLTYQAIMEISAMWSVLWAVCVLGYLYHDMFYTPALAWPLILMVIGLIWLFMPVKCSYKSARYWFVKLSNFTEGPSTEFSVDPVDGSDRCITNFYGIRSIVTIVPALIRFLQCFRRYRDTSSAFPHLANAGKYSTTFFVVLFGSLTVWHRNQWNLNSLEESPLFYCWVVAYLVSTTYTFVWDVKMDWGFFDKKQGENPYLREELVYSRKWFYYFAIAQDLVLRFAWTLNVTLGDSWILEPELLICVTAALECFRRFVWNFFRLENEHVNNVGQFRAVRDISLRPLNKGDLEEVVRMMDADEGVSHRGLRPVSSRALKARRRLRERMRKNRLRETRLNLGMTHSASLPSAATLTLGRLFNLGGGGESSQQHSTTSATNMELRKAALLFRHHQKT